MATIDIANGARNLEEIASTPGLDCEYVGPVDLTLGIVPDATRRAPT